MGDLSAGSVVLAITDNGVAVFYTLSGPEDLNIAEGRSAVLTKRRSTIGTAPGEPDAGPALERTTGAGGRPGGQGAAAVVPPLPLAGGAEAAARGDGGPLAL